MKKVINFCFLLYFLSACSSEKSNTIENEIGKFVNTFIGSEKNGNTFPGASLPFSMLQVSPDNGWSVTGNATGYDYTKEQIIGISHMHLNGLNKSELLDVLVMPTTRDVFNDTTANGRLFLQSFISTFSHANEQAMPGYYAVKLAQDNIFAEVTLSDRTALHSFNFPDNDTATVLIDLSWSLSEKTNTDTYLFVEDDSTTIAGYRFTKGVQSENKIYFAAYFSKKINKIQLIENGIIKQKNEVNNKYVTGAFQFENSKREPVLMKIAFSSVNEEAAIKTLNSEIDSWEFEALKNTANSKWNNYLGKIEINATDIQTVTNFYSALYRTMLSPNLYTGTDGKYRSVANSIETNSEKLYHNISFKDGYSAVFPLYNFLLPQKAESFIESTLTYLDSNPDSTMPGWLYWGNDAANTHLLYSSSVITGSWLKGVNNYNGLKALRGLKNSIKKGTSTDELYQKNQFISSKELPNAFKISIENSYNDWAIAQLAKNFADTSAYKIHIERSQYYKNLFNKHKKKLMAKMANNLFISDTLSQSTNYAVQFKLPHNIDTLINLSGGNNSFEAKLDSLFAPIYDMDFSESFLSNLNESNNNFFFEAAYLYNKIGKGHKTQKLVRLLLNQYFKPTPDGLPAADSFGNLSAWYVFSTLGFFPLDPVSGMYEIGSPIIKQAKVQLPNDQLLEIKVLNQSNKNIYVQSVSLNNKKIDGLSIPHESLINGGELVFEMTNKKEMAVSK